MRFARTRLNQRSFFLKKNDEKYMERRNVIVQSKFLA